MAETIDLVSAELAVETSVAYSALFAPSVHVVAVAVVFRKRAECDFTQRLTFSIFLPQFGQNAESSGISAPQYLHFILILHLQLQNI